MVELDPGHGPPQQQAVPKFAMIYNAGRLLFSVLSRRMQQVTSACIGVLHEEPLHLPESGQSRITYVYGSEESYNQKQGNVSFVAGPKIHMLIYSSDHSTNMRDRGSGRKEPNS